jgi:hypothetical protein
MLPISAKQSTDPIQLTTLSSTDITPKFQHQHAVFPVFVIQALWKSMSRVGKQEICTYQASLDLLP